MSSGPGTGVELGSGERQSPRNLTFAQFTGSQVGAVGCRAMARTESVEQVGDLPAALARLGLDAPRPVIVVVGGAAGLTGARADALAPALDHAIVPVCAELGAAIVDGGTDSGVMREVGRARDRDAASFDLVGVAAAGTFAGPDATVAEPAELEPHHTHFVIVPGTDWGDESPWIVRVAGLLSGDGQVTAVLFGGGSISRRDVGNLVGAGYPVFAVTGSGRLADELAASDPSADSEIAALQASDLVLPVAGLENPAALATALRQALAP
jgi:hypothetical protein